MKRYESYKDSGVEWIGEIPSHWKVERLKNNVSLITEVSDSSLKIGLENIESFTGKYLKTDTKYDGNGIAVEIGDLVYGKLRPYLCKAWIAVFPCNAVGDFYVFRGKGSTVAVPYIHKLFLSSQITGVCNASTYGARMPRISSSFMLNMSVPIPPSSEQQVIVDYLKDKTLKIEQYVSARERERELLDSLKQSEIANVVTKGLNPNVRMKDSGIPWIGMIPEHWKPCRNKDIFQESKLTVGENSNSYTLLSLTKQGVIIRDVSEGKGKFPKEFSSYKVVEPGDMIFCLFDVDETPRTVGLSSHYGMITGAYDVFKVKRVLPEFVLYYYLAIDDKKALRPLYKGLRKVVPLPTFMSAKMFIPPLEEQQAIVDYIEAKLSKINSCMADLQAEIDYLKEFKQRLISDVVTGQICVVKPQKGEKQ